MTLLCFVSLVALAARGTLAQSVKSCGGPADHLKNPVFKVTPDPPVKGSPLTIEVSGTLDEAMTSVTSNVDLQIQALGIVHASVTGAAPLSLSPGAPAGPFSVTVGPFTPASQPAGKAVVKGQIHVVNEKNEPVMCIELDIDTPGEANEAAVAPLQIDVPPGITSCGKATDHVPDFKVQASGGVTTMTGTLDEAIMQVSLEVDASIKVAFIHVPLKATVPVAFKPGIAKGPIKATFGPNTVVVKPALKAEFKGTVKVTDPKDEVICLNVDTIVGRGSLAEKSVGNCKKASYGFCCEVGVPCDCTKGTTAPGQCKPESFGFCCSVGTPCDCSVPPILHNVTNTLVI